MNTQPSNKAPESPSPNGLTEGGWRATVNPYIGWQVHFGPSGVLHGYCTFSYNDQAAERAHMIAQLPKILGECNQLRAEVERLQKENDEWDRLSKTWDEVEDAKDARINELESEKNEYRERLEYLSISLPLTEGYKITRESLRELLKKYIR